VQLNDYIFNLGLYWQMHDKPQLDNCNYKFTQLKVVVLRSFKYLSSELELVKILLHRAINLERLELIPPKVYRLCKFKKKDTPNYENLFCSWRASTRAVIKLHKYHVKKSFVNPIHPRCWLYTDAC